MNKIFKVIWNNAKHCYVVASELAKSYSKGGGSRSIRRAMVTLGVAAAVYAAAGSALAANGGGDLDNSGNYIGHDPYNVTIDSDSSVTGSVYGRKEDNDTNVEEASVTMTGGLVHYQVYGGYSSSGAAASNSVTISGNSTINGIVYGGWSIGKAASNSVKISDGTLNQHVFGGWSQNGDAASNSVNISGDTTNILGNIYGGVASYTGNAYENKVNIASGTLKEIYGGYSESGNTASNSVTISGDSTFIKESVYGGYVKSGTGSASYNIVNIGGGAFGSVYGGWSDSGNAVGNSVTISGGTNSYVNEYGNIERGLVYGGYSTNDTAASNSVNISGGTIYEGVYGGKSSECAAASNSVNISGGTIHCFVYGGDAGLDSESSNATSNSVNISGGTIDGWVYGGYSVSGKTVASNSVNISGGTFDSGSKIYAGEISSHNPDSSFNPSIKDNSVSLSGTVTNLNNVEIYGYRSSSDSVTHSGNELNIGRAVDYDDEGRVKRDTDGNIIYKNKIWQGKDSNGTTINKINQVANFESIVLHEVAWNESLPALAAVSFKYNNSTDLDGKVTLDISSLNFDKDNPTGTMTLLQSDNDNNFSNLKLKYNNVPAATIPDSGTTVKSEEKTLQSKGVKISYNYTQSVSLSDSNKKVNLTALNTYKKAELGSMKWSDGGYIFADSDTIVAGGLEVAFSDNFKVEGAEDKNEGDSLALLDLSDTNAVTSAAINNSTTLTYDRNPTSAASLTLKLSQTDVIKTNDTKNILTYTIGTKYVTKATFDKELTWNTSQPFYDASNSGYTFSGDTVIDAKNLTLAFTDSQKDSLKANDTMTLISAIGISNSNSVLQPDNNTFQLSRTGNSGTKFDGTATGVVLADSSVVKYKINTIETDKITLGSRSWSANAESLPDTWKVKTGIVIDANDFTFTSKAETALVSGDTKTLVAGSGIVADSKIADKNVEIEYTDNSVKLGATALGQIETITDAVQFKVNSVTLDSLDISGWNGTDDLSAVPDGWVANANGVNVTATSFDPELTSGSKTIITASSDMFKDENIDESIRFAENSSFKDDSKNGVIFSGKREGGVKASDDGKELTCYAMFKDVTGISFGEMNWGTIRDASTVNYDYANISNDSINISKLTFTNLDNINVGAETTLLTANNSLEAGENISHSQNFEKVADNGVKFESTFSGSVIRTTAGEIGYKAEGKTLNGVDLSEWNSTKEASAVPDVWTANANGVSVAGEFTEPELSAGEAKNILTASTAMFKDENIDESIRFAEKGSFTNDSENGLTLSGSQTGGVKATDEGKALTYYALEKTINKFDLAGWDGENSISAGNSWKFAESVSVETDGMSNLPDSDEEKQVFILKSDKEGYFANVAINGENAYGKKQNKFTDSDEAERVVLAGIQEKGVTFDSAKTNLVYKLGSKDVTSLKLNTIRWEDGAEILSRDKYNYSKLTTLDTKDFNITYEKPETVESNQSMTLLKANETLADMAAIDKSVSYQYEPLSGVTMDAVIMSRLEAKSGKVTLKTVSNKADKLTFKDIEWLDKGSVIDHKTMLNNVSFNGADVDTTRIAFTNKQKLDADMQMTLVSDFGDSVGTITGSKYKVGTAFEGEGSAYLEGSDLVFKTKTGAGLSDETHTTVMAMEAGIAALAVGNDHIGSVMESLAMATNRASDGVSTAASVGGGSSRYETGSHVDTNSWNIAVAVGKNLEKKDGTLEYGLFGEYGRGNYTLHMDGIADAGSGNTHYTGGGLLLKWTNSHDVYTEASFRMGNMKDKASNILHDGNGNAYGYDTNAKYRGGHFGIGKICREEGGTKLEIYGKYFYNEREGINFAAGADQYSLDKVRSRVMRAGFRLSSTDKKWNRYGGIAYDYEFGGESRGTVNGTAIRSASVKGGTLRGEFGYCREATKTNPWKTDISLFGFTGKRCGFGGSIAVEYHF